MKLKTGFLKIRQAFLGIVTEIMMTTLIMACAFCLAWLIVKVNK